MTLVELMVAVGITAIIMAISLSIFMSQNRTYNQSKNIKEAQETAQGGVELLKRDLMAAGWSVKPQMAFLFEDGAGVGNESDTITLNDYRIIDVDDPVMRDRFVNDVFDCPGGEMITGGPVVLQGTVNVPSIDINGDAGNDFVIGSFVITDSTTGADKTAQVSGVNPPALTLGSSISGSFVAPAIRYSVVNAAGQWSLNRADNTSGGTHPVTENVVDLQVAYKDNLDATNNTCTSKADQVTCSGQAGCQWTNGSCTGAWYGVQGCVTGSSGNGLGTYCSFSPFDPTRIALIRVTIVTRSTNRVEGRVWDPAYCRPAAENHAAAAVGSADCGYAYRTYTVLFEPRNTGPAYASN